MNDTNETTGHIIVRNGSDYGEFFWRESILKNEDGTPRHAATWTVVSSFGTYGFHWSHMGRPFAAFIADIGDDYLLSKIAREVFDDRKFIKWMNREIFTARCTKEQKAEATDDFRRLRMDYSGEALATLCHDSAPISHCQPEWSDCSSRSYDPQAVGFAKNIWPKFVEHLNGASLVKDVA